MITIMIIIMTIIILFVGGTTYYYDYLVLLLSLPFYSEMGPDIIVRDPFPRQKGNDNTNNVWAVCVWPTYYYYYHCPFIRQWAQRLLCVSSRDGDYQWYYY